MKLKLLLACAIAIVLAPASAFGANSPELTYPTGTPLAAESKIQAVNVGEAQLTWGGNTINCSSAKWKGKLTKNTGSELEADVESASFNSGAGKCSTSTLGASLATATENGTPWCLRSTPELADTEFQIRGGACGKTIQPIRLTVKTTTTTVIECPYERSEPISGTYQTHPQDAVLTSNNVTYTKVSGLACPVNFSLDTSFTFEVEGESPGPLYISNGPRLIDSKGIALGIGSPLKGVTPTSVLMTTNLGMSSCGVGEMTGTLTENNGSVVEADIESAALGSGCMSPLGFLNWTFNTATNGLPWCLRATSGMGADQFQIRGNSCAASSRPIRIVNETFSKDTVTCQYERAAALTGSFTTHPGDAVLTLENAVFLEVAPKTSSCPDEAQLDSSMTLEQEAEKKPLFIS
jgi:hypothetical protein